MMANKITRLIGYTRAPKAMFMVRHPVKGTKALVAAKGLKGLVTTRAGAALGAALAVPLGLIMLTKRGNNRELR